MIGPGNGMFDGHLPEPDREPEESEPEPDIERAMGGFTVSEKDWEEFERWLRDQRS